MQKLNSLFIFLIMLSSIYPDWGSIIESEINLVLETKYEIDLDKDGVKESDKAEGDTNVSYALLFIEESRALDILQTEIDTQKLILSFKIDSYNLYLISRVERPPNHKLS